MIAQLGEKAQNAKPLRGFVGAAVLEVIEDYQGDTYRAVYTVKLASAVYVLHCFQKKSPRGSQVLRLNQELILKQDIAARLGITQPQVSELKHGKFDRFSSDRLIALLGALGCDVEVRVTPAPRRRAGRFTVKAA